MDHLNKQQVVLLCILVALVTSVATAISVVSLTDDTNTPTQTIYRVIETTIDKVADIPTDKEKDTPTKETPKTSTVLTPADIVASGAKSLVRIYETSAGEDKFVALGVVVDSSGSVLASSVYNVDGYKYVATTPDGARIDTVFKKSGIAESLSLFELQYTKETKTKVTPITIKNLTSISLGDSVVALGGKEGGNVVSIGIISEIKSFANSTSTDAIITDINLSSAISGFLLFNTSGELIAVEQSLSDISKIPVFVSTNLIKDSF